MKVVAGMRVGRVVSSALAGVAMFGSVAILPAQAPYLLPYTIQSIAGGGTSVTLTTGTDPNGKTIVNSTPCTGTGTNLMQYDSVGDGCLAGSTSVVLGSDVHDVVVDLVGNIFFLDNGNNGTVRRIDAHTGVITVYAGSNSVQVPVCAATLDKYGDGCAANDGKANNNPSPSPAGVYYTGAFGKARGLGIGRNGDLFIADYGAHVIHRVAAATGQLSAIAGTLASGNTLSGNGGVKGYSGDGGIAFNPTLKNPQGAGVNAPRGVTADSAGNVYIADTTNNVIRKITYSAANPYGIISTLVGSDSNGTSPANPAVAGATNGDGGLAANALVGAPEDVEVDSLGNLFWADQTTSRVRVLYVAGTTVANIIAKTNPGTTAVSGNVYSIMGSGVSTTATPTTTSNGPVLATSVSIAGVRKIAIDARDNVYLADNGNEVIWFLDAQTGYMRVIAGQLGLGATPNGNYCGLKSDSFGDNCPATSATFFANSAMGVAVDTPGNVYISDTGDHLLRKIFTNQNFPATVAGTTISQILEVHFGAGDSPAVTNPYVITGSQDYKVASSPCNPINADLTTDCLVTINFTPTISGTDNAGLVVNTLLNQSASIGLTGSGSTASLAIDPGTTASFGSGLKGSLGIAQDAAGNTYIADTGNNRVMLYSATGASSVFAGTGASGYTGDGAAATLATLSSPSAVTIARNGLVYIADTGNNAVRMVNPMGGAISTVAGGNATLCSIANDAFGNGCPGTSAILSKPAGLVADPDGNIYIADSGNGLIRELTPGGNIFLYGGGASTVCNSPIGDGCPANQATFSNPTALAMDVNRNLYIADTGNNKIRSIVYATGVVGTIAGTGSSGVSSNGSSATGTPLNAPTGIALDGATNLYIADTGNSAIQIVNLVSGVSTINTVAGALGASGTGTLPGTASAVQLNAPGGVFSTPTGTLIVLDSGNNRAFTVTRNSLTKDFGTTNLNASSPALQITETSTGASNTSLASPLFTTSGNASLFAVVGTSSNGCTPGQNLASGTSCLLSAQFNANSLGKFTATFTEAGTNTINSPTPFIQLAGTGAILSNTSSVTVVTTPATGTPQYSIPFTVTTTITPANCNINAPTCVPSGTLTFFVNGSQVGLPVAVSSTGTASQTISGLNVGKYTVTAVYGGDMYYASSSAPALSVTVSQGTTATAVTATPANGLQFSNLVLTAKVTTKTTAFPTGSVQFFVGTTKLLGPVMLSATGSASLSDVTAAATGSTAATTANSFGLSAGTYTINAVYSGDANYVGSTATTQLIIAPDPATFTMALPGGGLVGTAQGSTAQIVATITPQNTFAGTITFSCTNLPANSSCTFGPPTSLTFVATPLVPSSQQITVTLFTDVPSGVFTSHMAGPQGLPAARSGEVALASLLGWPVLLSSLAGIFAFRRRLRSRGGHLNLLTMVALFGLLTGTALVTSGCGSSGAIAVTPTPVGTYSVNLVATGPNGAVTVPMTFTVGAGFPGQL